MFAFTHHFSSSFLLFSSLLFFPFSSLPFPFPFPLFSLPLLNPHGYSSLATGNLSLSSSSFSLLTSLLLSFLTFHFMASLSLFFYINSSKFSNGSSKKHVFFSNSHMGHPKNTFFSLIFRWVVEKTLFFSSSLMGHRKKIIFFSNYQMGRRRNTFFDLGLRNGVFFYD